MPKGIMQKPEEHLERKHEIKETALRLFEEKGFQKTSLREISAAIGMGKSSLYDYFTSKDEIVIFAYEKAIDDAIIAVNEILTAVPSPIQALREIMQNNLIHTQKYKHLIVWLNAEAGYLDKAYQNRLNEARHRYQDLIQSVIETGIKNKVLRSIDPALATRLLINSMLSIAYTSRPSGSPEEMLQEAVDIFLHGIQINS